MDSDKIKVLVKWVNELTSENQPIDDHPRMIMEAMLADCAKSPTFAVAIIQHLRDANVDLLTLVGETADRFRERFGPHVDRLGEQELVQIRKISSKLFS